MLNQTSTAQLKDLHTTSFSNQINPDLLKLRTESRILVVEDDIDTANRLKNWFDELGYGKVTIITSNEKDKNGNIVNNAFMELIRGNLHNEPYDCLCTDLFLNGENGFDLIKKNPEICPKGVLIHSGSLISSNAVHDLVVEMSCFTAAKAKEMIAKHKKERLLHNIPAAWILIVSKGLENSKQLLSDALDCLLMMKNETETNTKAEFLEYMSGSLPGGDPASLIVHSFHEASRNLYHELESVFAKLAEIKAHHQIYKNAQRINSRLHNALSSKESLHDAENFIHGILNIVDKLRVPQLDLDLETSDSLKESVKLWEKAHSKFYDKMNAARKDLSYIISTKPFNPIRFFELTSKKPLESKLDEQLIYPDLSDQNKELRALLQNFSKLSDLVSIAHFNIPEKEKHINRWKKSSFNAAYKFSFKFKL